MLEYGSETEQLPRAGLPATGGTMQYKLVSQTLLNVVVDNVIRTCLARTVED